MGTFPQFGCLLVLICTITIVNSYSKYGRGCGDIGCLPNEMCVMAQDSCNYGQHDGKECGSYPTCRKGANNGGSNSGGGILNPAPQNTRLSSSSNPSSASQPNNNPFNNNNNNQNSQPLNPNYVFGSPNQQPPYANVPIFPYHQPTQQPPFQQFPQPNNPQYPQYPQYPSHVPNNPQNPYNPPVIFGNPPAYYNPRPTTREPSLLHQFLYNKQGGRRNSSERIKMFAVLPIFFGFIAIIFHRITMT